jgi:branched-subunit amino acid permease
LLLDAVAVLVFTVLGRRTHEEALGLTGVLEVAAPFLLAMVAGWLVSRAWRRPAWLGTGVVVWAVTVALGMLLRRTLFDRGTALSFVIVATLFLAAAMLGWRLVATAVTARTTRAARAATRPSAF